MMTPRYFQDAVLPCGTTTAMCDPHELANVLGISGIQYFLKNSELLDLDLWVMMSSCVPATSMETNGGGEIQSQELVELATHSRALGLAEMMNVPGLLHADPSVLSKIEAFLGRPMDGHCPLVRGKDLSTCAVAGISSCHESSELDEAQEKLVKGIAVWIREGSVAKDLRRLAPLLTLATSSSLGFCTDDRNPLDISLEGHIDHLVRSSIRYGVDAEVAYRTASWSVARHYGLDQRWNRVGAVAPGWQADLIILEDAQSCSISKVLKKGNWAHELESASEFKMEVENSIRAVIPEDIDLVAPSGMAHVIGLIEGKIITHHFIKPSDSIGVARLSVLERYGKGTKPSNAYVEGFGPDLRGAIASSVGHDSHNLIVVGQKTSDMRVALAALSQMGGGFCVVRDGGVLAQLELPIGGLMSDRDADKLKTSLLKLKEASQSIGCILSEPFLHLAFLSLPVIPSLKLTDKGLVDVDEFRIIPILAS